MKKSQIASKIFQRYKKLAVELFESQKFDLSLKFFSLALKYNPNDIDSKVGALLSDYAGEDSLDAISLYDYYISSIELGEPRESILENILQMIKQENSFFDEILTSIEEFTNSISDGIDYKDFIAIAKTKPNMRVALEDLMFSSRLIINNKEDMMSFIELLYEYDFKDEAFVYLENAISIFPDDYFEDKFKKFLHS